MFGRVDPLVHLWRLLIYDCSFDMDGRLLDKAGQSERLAALAALGTLETLELILLESALRNPLSGPSGSTATESSADATTDLTDRSL